jgi:DNA-binding transcriptional regulator YiaG
MTPSEIKSIRQRAGLSQSGLARVLRVEDGRSVRRWEAGDRAISGAAAIILEMLDKGELPQRYL